MKNYGRYINKRKELYTRSQYNDIIETYGGLKTDVGFVTDVADKVINGEYIKQDVSFEMSGQSWKIEFRGDNCIFDDTYIGRLMEVEFREFEKESNSGIKITNKVGEKYTTL